MLCRMCLLKLFLGLFQGCQLMCNCQLYSCLRFLILLWVVHRYNSKFKLHYWRLKHVWKSLQIGWGDMCSLMLVIKCGFLLRIYLWKVLVGNFLHCGLDHLRFVRYLVVLHIDWFCLRVGAYMMCFMYHSSNQLGGRLFSSKKFR